MFGMLKRRPSVTEIPLLEDLLEVRLKSHSNHIVNDFSQKLSVKETRTSGYEMDGVSRGFWRNNKIVPNNSESKSRPPSGQANDTIITQALPLSAAEIFIDVVPIVMCIIDSNGNLQCYNPEFEKCIYLDSFKTGNEKKNIYNMLDIVCSEDSDQFYKKLQLFTSDKFSFEMSENFNTKMWKDSSVTSTLYNWTLAFGPDRSYIIVTGKPAVVKKVGEIYTQEWEEFSEDMIRSNFSALTQKTSPTKCVSHTQKSSEEGRIGDKFSGSSGHMMKTPPAVVHVGKVEEIVVPWQSFLEKVEAKTKKVIELKEAQLKSAALTETLETKRVFVRHVSHEIRTPLNVVLSGLEYIGAHRDTVSPEIYETILDIKEACLVAINILNDLLTYEKLDSNILTLELSTCEITDLIQRVHGMFSIQARYADIACSIENTLDEETMVVIDEAKFAQVVRNLISNALKFTPSGGSITLKLLKLPDNKRVRVEVHDTGPGMTKEQRRRLFKEVVQFNAKELQGGQGSGLGLYLSHRIMQLHDGDIGVDTEREGSGSVFFLELPVVEAPPNPKGHCHSFTIAGGGEAAEELFGERDQRKLRLLIVDDAVLVRKFHMKILASSAEEFIEASNGEEAVAKYREQIESGGHIDAILMDSSMPFMNGTTATRLIRDLGYTGKVFGITGNAFQSDIDDFLSHGADEVLIKPLTLNTYAHMIQNIREKPLLPQ